MGWSSGSPWPHWHSSSASGAPTHTASEWRFRLSSLSGLTVTRDWGGVVWPPSLLPQGGRGSSAPCDGTRRGAGGGVGCRLLCPTPFGVTTAGACEVQLPLGPDDTRTEGTRSDDWRQLAVPCWVSLMPGGSGGWAHRWTWLTAPFAGTVSAVCLCQAGNGVSAACSDSPAPPAGTWECPTYFHGVGVGLGRRLLPPPAPLSMALLQLPRAGCGVCIWCWVEQDKYYQNLLLSDPLLVSLAGGNRLSLELLSAPVHIRGSKLRQHPVQDVRGAGGDPGDCPWYSSSPGVSFHLSHFWCFLVVWCPGIFSCKREDQGEWDNSILVTQENRIIVLRVRMSSVSETLLPRNSPGGLAGLLEQHGKGTHFSPLCWQPQQCECRRKGASCAGLPHEKPMRHPSHTVSSTASRFSLCHLLRRLAYKLGTTAAPSPSVVEMRSFTHK